MNRRSFFGLAVGASAAAFVPASTVEAAPILWPAGSIRGEYLYRCVQNGILSPNEARAMMRADKNDARWRSLPAIC